MQALYPRDWQTMVNNCKVFQAFGANNLAAAEQMAQIVGFISGPAMLALDRDEMLLQIAGDEAVVARLPNYLTDPAFAGLFATNPIFDPERDPMPERRTLREYLRPGARVRMPISEHENLRKNAIDELIAGKVIEAISTL